MAQYSEARPDEDFHRVLAPDGTLVSEPPDVSAETLRDFYWTMVLNRRFDEKALNMQRRGEISIHARVIGEEATPLGTAAALEPGDWCFPSYRQSPAAFYWGASMAQAFAGLMGAEPETIQEHLPVPEDDSPLVNFTPIYVPLAVNIPNAVGSAMSDSLNDREIVSLGYIGDGSTSEGDFHEAMNFAGVFDAPVVIVCQNNQWAISVPANRQTASSTFAEKGDAYGVPNERVDGNDVLAVYQVTKQAVERARNGDGPGFIECVTYRLGEHNTADEESLYRDEEEEEFWAERDPIERLESYLLSEDVLSSDDVTRLDEKADEHVQNAVDRARDVPMSDPQRMFDNHLHGESWMVEHQRAELAAELAGENPFTDFTGSGLE